MKLATAAQMKELDRRAIEEEGIPSIELMEHAAQAIAEAVRQLPGSKKRLAILCGSGNNGGDGIAAARHLLRSCQEVRVFLVGTEEKMTDDAREERRRLEERGTELESFNPADGEQQAWICQSDVCIDALLGVGLSREIAPESQFAQAVQCMNESQAYVIAADIPSGISADSGKVLGCAVKANKTITFTLMKAGLLAGAGAIHAGRVSVCPIGVPEGLIREVLCDAQSLEWDFAAQALPKRRADGHKGTFGKLLILGGAVGYTGAPYLTASAAMSTGCGLVSMGVPESIWPIEAVKCTSAMPFPLPEEGGMLDEGGLEQIRQKLASCDVLALGPGLGRSDGTEKLVLTLLEETAQPVVLDADGINALSAHIDQLDSRRDRVTILTPHDGEFERLAPGALKEGDRLKAAREFAVAHGCILVLKGYRTLVASPEGNVLVNTTGNSGLAKGGSGDVLTGIIASLLAQGASPMEASAGGVWIHGRAGDLAAEALTSYAVTPADVIGQLPWVLRELTEEY